ncbi:monovalent cation/H(+) antiporter subunit G [Rhizobiaceae bacterium n13]|uniref:Monovalent cation/H(+) antiporter subunit G n=1 Tax=Ferirhizobium litorale TaxID=2927786 RepID=A0AAE3QB66_9HYPH|nr:monovalent cation/H(+) antiporter subunit G [Fererhizobium litorale]MDI7862145.1 monovalent cation/H(+) antiporter subunit G [Fererhizobium litorale]MDI7922582.1 monovalent cation/H(+) antiporter subunit G [Fererhizobium litorale]
MNHAAELPLWAAIAVAAFLVMGAALALIGAIGFFRLATFYERLHAPTLGTSWGTGGVVMASMIFFTMIGGRPVIHEILIGIFISITTPVTLMLLARAALYRDRAENDPLVPPSVASSNFPPADESKS